MTDARIKQNYNFAEPLWDLVVRSDTHLLDEREELATAARVALGTDRLADTNEILPDPDSTNRRGWWGDMEAESIWEGWSIGTKNWLLTRAKITEAPAEEGATLERARIYTLEALQPFIDRGVASRVEVEATRAELHRINVVATIYRGPNEEIDLRYQLLWDEAGAALDGPAVERIVEHNDLEVSSPVLGKPLLATHYYFNTVLLNIQPPVLSTANYSRTRNLAANNWAISSPQLTSPTMYSSHKMITGGSLAVSSPALTKPTLVVFKTLTASPLAVSAPVLTAAQIAVGFGFTEMFGVDHPDQILLAHGTLNPATQKLMKGGVEVTYQVVTDCDLTGISLTPCVPVSGTPTLTIN